MFRKKCTQRGDPRDTAAPTDVDSPSEVAGRLQDVFAQVRRLQQRLHLALHVLRVDLDGLALAIGRLEGHVLDDALDDGVQPARADVLHRLVGLHNTATTITTATSRQGSAKTVPRVPHGRSRGWRRA